MNYVKSEINGYLGNITAGKVYQADFTVFENTDLALIRDDHGDRISIRIPGSGFLEGGAWTKCDADGNPL